MLCFACIRSIDKKVILPRGPHFAQRGAWRQETTHVTLHLAFVLSCINREYKSCQVIPTFCKLWYHEHRSTSSQCCLGLGNSTSFSVIAIC